MSERMQVMSIVRGHRSLPSRASRAHAGIATGKAHLKHSRTHLQRHMLIAFQRSHCTRTLESVEGFSDTVNQSPLRSPESFDPKRFGDLRLFAFVATIDTSPYVRVAKALDFRSKVCGGSGKIARILLRKAGRVLRIFWAQVL